MTGRLLFDAAVNTALAFAGSLALVALVLRATRRIAGDWHLALLGLPFAKALWELVRGVPEGAFFWQSIRGAQQELGSFQIGVGLEGPRIQLVALLSAISGGRRYPTSAGELLSRGLGKHGLGWLAGALGFAVAAVALALALRRLIGAARFERARRRARPLAVALDTVRVGPRTVDVYLSDGAGIPFAGGLRRPYICFPRASFAALGSDEREAVLAHELAHIRRYDVLTAAVVSLLSDLLWFCPGIRMLGRWVRGRLELAADRAAVASGVAPQRLASALVRVKEHAAPSAGIGFGSYAGVRERIAALLQAPERVSWRGWLLRLAILVLTANTILFAVFFGNH